MALDEGNNVGLSPVIIGPLPNPEENVRRIDDLPFCAKRRSRGISDFSITDFHKELRKTVTFGKQAFAAWWMPDKTPWAAYSLDLVKDGQNPLAIG
jgi:hypothetical protein